MNTLLIVLFIIVVLCVLLAILYIHFYNKYSESIIRIQEAEIRIDNNIREKYDLLIKIITEAKNIIKIDEKRFSDIIMLKSKRISTFDMDRTLIKGHNDFLSLYNNNIKLRENDEIYKANKQIELVNDELETLRNYYNVNVLNYNRMVKKIPTNIIALIKKYKEKPCYDLKNMEDDDYEDFKL